MLELMLIYVSTDLSREDRDENSRKQPEMKETLEMSQFKVFVVHMWTQKTQGVARSGADGCWWNTDSPNAEQPLHCAAGSNPCRASLLDRTILTHQLSRIEAAPPWSTPVER